jgi:hypothetical protein
VFPDLVYQHGTVALYQRNGAMLRDRKRDVLKNGPDEMAAQGGFAHLRVAATHDSAAKVGEAAVGDDDQVCVESLLDIRLAVAASLYANHTTGERALDQIRHRRLEDVDARRGLGTRAEVLHEPAMVERAAFGTAGVRYVHGVACI